MPGLNDPNDPAFTDPSQNGAWKWNPDTRAWEPTDPVVGALWSIPKAVGLQANTIDAGSPGASLDAGRAGDDRARLAGYLSQLTNSAVTGGGAWEQALQQNTAATKSTAEALGQSAGLDAMTASRNIGNAKAGAEQRAVGQGNLLRAQTQQQASGQLGDILGGQMGLDAQQAAGQAAAAQGLVQANRTLEGAASKNRADFAGAYAQAGTSALGASEGGSVPGQPKVFGDDSVNDVVPAKLTPLEIVLPLSVTMAPDAPEKAAAFVAAVKAKKQGAYDGAELGFDGGGQVPQFGDIDSGGTGLKKDPGDNFISSRQVAAPEPTYAPGKMPPLVSNGGLLDTRGYDATRGAAVANQDRLGAAAAGYGPSVAPQAFQNATDATIADAMRADANDRGVNPSLVGMAAEQQQGAAGNAAGIVAGESQRSGEAFADALQRQRSQDLALATAQQQAAWRNTMMNAGISLEQQNQIRNLLGAAGQGAVAAGGMFDSPSKKPYHYDTGTGRYDTTPAWEDPGIASSPDEWAQPFAEGGVVAHLSRQGTRAKQKRPSDTRKPDSWGTTSKAGQGDPSEWADFPQKTRVGTQREPDGPEQHFAGGGEVSAYERLRSLLAGASASPIQFDGSGIPLGAQPGPFAATQDGGSMPPRPVVAPVSRPQSLDDPNRPTPLPIPADAASRERPFIAKPASPVQSTPSSPAPARIAPKPVQSAGPDQFALANEAGEQKAAAETQQADAQAAALMDGQKALEANAIDAKERAAKASQAAQQQLAVIQQAREEMKRIDTTIDSGKLWKDRSIVGKFFSIIGLVAGAIGNDNGVNRAASLLNQQIDREIENQKAGFELALRKGQSAVTSAENLYSISRQAAQDDIAAGLAAKGSALDLVANKVALAAAKAGSPMAKANLTALHAKVMADKDAADKAAHQRMQDMNLKWYGAKTDRMQAEAQGAKAAGGDKAQAALIANVEQENKTIQDQGLQLKALIKKHGTTGGMTGPGKAEMQQALMNIATSAAKLRDPNSVARSSEVDAELKTLFQPGFLQKEDTAIASIDNYLKNAEKRRNDAYSVRGLQAPGGVAGGSAPKAGGQDDAGARAWLADPKNANSPFRAKVQAKLEGR